MSDVDGEPITINGDPDMDPKTLEALVDMARLAGEMAKRGPACRSKGIPREAIPRTGPRYEEYRPMTPLTDQEKLIRSLRAMKVQVEECLARANAGMTTHADTRTLFDIATVAANCQRLVEENYPRR